MRLSAVGLAVVAAEAVLEGVVVDQQQDGRRRVRRSAAGEQERLAGRPARCAMICRIRVMSRIAAQLRQGDVPDLLPDAAPSTSAASYSSGGTPVSAAR